MRLFGRIGRADRSQKRAAIRSAAIEAVMSWDAFAERHRGAKLSQPEDFDFLHRIGESFATLPLRAGIPRRAITGRARRQGRARCHRGAARHEHRQRPQGARRRADRFIKPRWQKLVLTDTGIDRRYYELCALSEMKNALRSGDIWVQGSRQFKDFEDYLVPPAKFASLKQASELPLAVATDCDQYLNRRLTLLERSSPPSTAWRRQRSAGRHHHRVGPEDHAARCGGARHRAGADRPDGDDPAARQDHRTAAGGRWMDGLHPHFTHLKSGDLAKDKTCC